jgi:polysaccharide pyruvyl transferase WcaK-like protein
MSALKTLKKLKVHVIGEVLNNIADSTYKLNNKGKIMKLVTLFDTSIASLNIGDGIIMDAVREHLQPLITDQMVTMSTHSPNGKPGRKITKKSDYSIIGGTNLLASHLRKFNQWKFSYLDLIGLNNVVLMGVGWWQYQAKPDLYTKLIYRKILSANMLHSVRDSYTEKMLKSIGIDNVINTGCMTMWNLTPEHCSLIPSKKSDSVIFTITDYNPDIANDTNLIKTLLENYKLVTFWPQGAGDIGYFTKLIAANPQFKQVVILNATLDAYNDFLSTHNTDYIGTRLHAGVRALQFKRRTIIIGIDNRAKEKAKDFNIVVVDRNTEMALASLINKSLEMNIQLPIENIEKWKSQFN